MSLEATLNWKHDYLNVPILVSPGKTVFPQARPVQKQMIEGPLQRFAVDWPQPPSE